MKNPYKRRDVFLCNQEAHREFRGRVSVYHVLKEKACYPQGCVYFLWHCVLKEKGNACIHGFDYVGRKCRGCTYFDAQKVHLQPRLLLDEPGWAALLDELDSFETWIKEHEYRRFDIAGRIASVKPWFEQEWLPGEKHTRMRGYLLVFRSGFIGMDALEDTFYVRVSEKQMKEAGFLPRMKLEFRGEFRMDRGRMVIVRSGGFEVKSPGRGRTWTRDEALVAVRTATPFDFQPEQCLSCPWGALADVRDLREPDEARVRRLFCLKGIADPESCYVYARYRAHREKRKKRGKKRRSGTQGSG